MLLSQQYGNATIHLSVLNQLATLEVLGTFGKAACHEMLSALVPMVALASPLACVVMYDRATLEAPVSELHGVSHQFASKGLIIKTPVAVVVLSKMLQDTMRHCDAMNAIGVHRAAFTERSAAMTWAASRVAVIQEHLMERRSRQLVA
jgi:hypothetical protein